MKDRKPENESAVIVLKGDLNPAILHPSWLVARELIPEDLVESAGNQLVSSELTAIDLDWFSIRARKNEFVAFSADPARYPDLGDLVVGIFHFLEFTPIRLLGLNRRMHFRVETEERWHELGDIWAPKGPWMGILPGAGHRPDDTPGLRTLVMEGNRHGSRATYLRVKLEPSIRVNPGVYVDTNEHYVLTSDHGAMEAVGIISEELSAAQDFALYVARRLLDGGDA